MKYKSSIIQTKLKWTLWKFNDCRIKIQRLSDIYQLLTQKRQVHKLIIIKWRLRIISKWTWILWEIWSNILQFWSCVPLFPGGQFNCTRKQIFKASYCVKYLQFLQRNYFISNLNWFGFILGRNWARCNLKGT